LSERQRQTHPLADGRSASMPPVDGNLFSPSDWIALASVVVAGIVAVAGYTAHWKLQRGRYQYEAWAGIQGRRVSAYAEFRNRALRIMEQQRNGHAPDKLDLEIFANSHGLVQLICSPPVARAADAAQRLVFDSLQDNGPSDPGATFAAAMKDLKDEMQRELGVTPY